MPKRLTTPVAKPGQIVARWGRADQHSAPGIVYAYPDLAGKCASRVLMDAIEGPRFRPSWERIGSYEVEPSLAQELDALGYDLTTLRITISKKAPPASLPESGDATVGPNANGEDHDG